MTELIAEATEVEPSIIYQGYLSSIDEVVEHVKAADTLGLGFRVESYTVSSGDDDDIAGSQGEFEFTLLGELPVRPESEA
ncbi:MAG TPA: hypothetical protein VF062_12955 [Candidatus Limnocylindrales bacterium]